MTAWPFRYRFLWSQLGEWRDLVPFNPAPSEARLRRDRRARLDRLFETAADRPRNGLAPNPEPLGILGVGETPGVWRAGWNFSGVPRRSYLPSKVMLIAASNFR